MKLRIVCIADTHGSHLEMTHPIPDGDILVHAGDICKYGTIGEVQAYNDWIGQFPHPFKILVAGNHDRPFEISGQLCKDTLTNSIYLENSSVEIEGVKFYGTPVQPEFMGWAFNFPPEKREFYWNQIPEDTDILITHCPPVGILDATIEGDFVGCPLLARRLDQLPNVKLNIFGHIHWSYGFATVNDKTFVNAAICGESYIPRNKPIVVEWDNGVVTVVEPMRSNGIDCSF